MTVNVLLIVTIAPANEQVAGLCLKCRLEAVGLCLKCRLEAAGLCLKCRHEAVGPPGEELAAWSADQTDLRFRQLPWRRDTKERTSAADRSVRAVSALPF